MFTLDTKKAAIKYIVITLFCIMFSIVYEVFSHGVYSIYMVLAPLVPFALGVIILSSLKNKESFTKLSYDLYNASIFTLMFGFYIKGILDIFGTTNNLVYIYYIVAGVLLAISVVINLFKNRNYN